MSEKKTAPQVDAAKTEEPQVDAAKTVDPMEEKVSFTAPIDPTGQQRDIILSVNGETIRVQRGATVDIKRKFVEVYQNSTAQRSAAYRVMAAAAKGASAPIAEM